MRHFSIKTISLCLILGMSLGACEDTKSSEEATRKFVRDNMPRETIKRINCTTTDQRKFFCSVSFESGGVIQTTCMTQWNSEPECSMTGSYFPPHAGHVIYYGGSK